MVCFPFLSKPPHLWMLLHKPRFVTCVDMETGNKIGVRGVNALCVGLKDNTTLTALDIGGEVS